MYSGTMTNTTAWTLIGYGFFLLPLTLFLNSHLIQEFAGIKKFLQCSVPLKSKTQVCYRTLCQQITDVCESMQSVWKAITCLTDPGWEKTLAKLLFDSPKKMTQDIQMSRLSSWFYDWYFFLCIHGKYISTSCRRISSKSWCVYLMCLPSHYRNC